MTPKIYLVAWAFEYPCKAFFTRGGAKAWILKQDRPDMYDIAEVDLEDA